MLENNKPVVITQNFTVEDFIKVDTLCLKMKPVKRILKLLIMIISIALIIYYGYLTIITYQSYKIIDTWRIMLCIVYGTAIFMFSSIYKKFKIKRFYKKKGNNEVFEETKYNFSENNIIMKTKNKNTTFEWNGIVKVVMSKNYYLLYVTAYSAIQLKVSNIDSDTLNQLTELIINKVNKENIKIVKY